ncbi:MAG: hypothetical protein A3H24_10520 [Rhodoferax sp. RIFCSPLOWO2_12_FULL_60_11]|nr:MAG: hypothetical protein A3H24_10520 [Rhodoferax sp. RIFCSPLOWO2_12_FULL_60_11]
MGADEPCSRWRSRHVFVQAQDIAFGVLKPGRLLRAEHADMVDRFQVGVVVIGKSYATLPKPSNGISDVVDAKT